MKIVHMYAEVIQYGQILTACLKYSDVPAQNTVM